MQKQKKLSSSYEKDSKRFLTCYLVVFSLLSGVALALYFYSAKDVYSTWTFRVNDPPWLPPGVTAIPVVGTHYFGDFQLPYFLALDPAPYSWSFYNLNLPFGFVVFSLFSFFSIKIATISFLVLSSTLYWATLRKAIGTFDSENANLLATMVTLFSLPTIICLDRGGAQMLAFSAFIYGVLLFTKSYRKDDHHKKKSNEVIISTLLLAFSLSLKIYLAIPLILILGYKNIRWLIRIFTTLFFSNLILSFFYGGPLQVISGLSQAYLWQTGDSDAGWIFGGVSLSKFFAIIYYYSHSPAERAVFAEQYQDYVFLPGLLYLLLICFTIWRNKLLPDSSYRIGISLTTVFLVTPVAHAYTLVICSAITVFGLKSLYENKERLSKVKIYALLITASLSLMPIPSYFYLTLIGGFWICHLIFVLITDGLRPHRELGQFRRINQKQKVV
jgi:hypothetical protein